MAKKPIRYCVVIIYLHFCWSIFYTIIMFDCNESVEIGINWSLKNRLMHSLILHSRVTRRRCACWRRKEMRNGCKRWRVSLIYQRLATWLVSPTQPSRRPLPSPGSTFAGSLLLLRFTPTLSAPCFLYLVIPPVFHQSNLLIMRRML